MDDPCDPWFVPERHTKWAVIKDVYQRWLPTILLISALVWVAFVYFLEPARPPIGLYIAGVGVLAIVITIWPPERNWSKAAWLGVFFALTGLEIVTLYQERTENQTQQRNTRKEENDAFKSIADGLTTSINNNQKAFEATMQKMQALAALSSDAIKTTTGGDGYCSMYFLNVVTEANGSVTARVSIANEGKYPMYGILASIINLEEQVEAQKRSGITFDTINAGKTDLSIGDLTPKPFGLLWPTPVVLSRTDRPTRLVVRFSSTRGLPWAEVVNIRKVGNGWSVATQISREDQHGKSKVLRTNIPPDFPRKAGEDIWK